ncbi:MAG TPA: HAD family phosphatase, partial [Actinomycetota bacterium]|nr:HAD family phosphatase [Actinomycetota bacterium]
MATKEVVFDLGGVLIDWDPRYLYRKLLADEAAVGEFLATVCTPEWNAEQDRGRPFAEGVAELVERHPVHAAAITAYHERWTEMLGG